MYLYIVVFFLYLHYLTLLEIDSVDRFEGIMPLIAMYITLFAGTIGQD